MPGSSDIYITNDEGYNQDFLKEIKEKTKEKFLDTGFSYVSEKMFPPVAYSDHLNYWKFKIPAIMVTSGAFIKNKNYHEPTDVWDTLDYDKMELLVRQLLQII